MRRSLILLLAIAALAAPSAALAAEPAARYFEIRAVTIGDQTIEIQGKGFIEAGRFSVTAGCNSIGGDVTVDGDQLTIGQLVMTEMACAEPLATAEGALLKFLDGGVITMGADAWTNAAGSMAIIDYSVDPVPAPSDDPDGVVVSPPDLGFGLDDCVGILPADEFPTMDGGGSGSGGGSTDGSGGGTDGSTGSGVAEPGATVIVIDPALPPAPAPDATGAVEPGTEPVPMPAETAGEQPPVPAETATDLPLPVEDSPIPVDPGVVVEQPTPVPGGTTPTLEECRQLVARIRTLGPTMDGGATTGSGAAPEVALDKDATGTSTPVLPFAAVVLALGAIAFVLHRRSRPAHEAATESGTDAASGTDLS